MKEPILTCDEMLAMMGEHTSEDLLDGRRPVGSLMVGIIEQLIRRVRELENKDNDD